MEKLSREYITNRVDDWKNRIQGIYTKVKEVCSKSPELSTTETRKVRMYEELMREYNVNPVEIPILDVKKNNTLLVTFKPIGLWVIGANGRIDILSKNISYILVDNGTGSPDWKIFSPKNRNKGIVFDVDFIEKLVGL